MPAVKNVGEPCAGEPHARFEVAAGGNQASRASTCRAAQAPLADPTNPKGRHAAAPGRHASAQLRLRTAHAGDDIDGAGQCFWFVADAGLIAALPLSLSARPMRKP